MAMDNDYLPFLMLLHVVVHSIILLCLCVHRSHHTNSQPDLTDKLVFKVPDYKGDNIYIRCAGSSVSLACCRVLPCRTSPNGNIEMFERVPMIIGRFCAQSKASQQDVQKPECYRWAVQEASRTSFCTLHLPPFHF